MKHEGVHPSILPSFHPSILPSFHPSILPSFHHSITRLTPALRGEVSFNSSPSPPPIEGGIPPSGARDAARGRSTYLSHLRFRKGLQQVGSAKHAERLP